MLGASDRPIAEVVATLAEHGVEATYLVPTKTGLEKSILDATAPVRDYLRRVGLHDYDIQDQGPQAKVRLRAFFVQASGLKETSASLYRPKTKEGDPRIWFAGLGTYTSPGNLLAVIGLGPDLYVLNASDRAIWASRNATGSALHSLLEKCGRRISGASQELLRLLKAIGRRGYIPSVRAGDTGVGATLEHALGIKTNSSKKPDYKGIEIKSGRTKGVGRSKNRVNLFSQVPNWEESAYKDGGELLKAHGYVREGVRRLNCTVANQPNSQHLYLQVNTPKDKMEVRAGITSEGEAICVWRLAELRNRLVEKQSETFWVKAEARSSGGREEFHYVEVEHTRGPLVGNLEPLLEAGKITLDFTLKTKANGSPRDHGYLFKIWPQDLRLLFPPSKKYSLLD